MLGYENFADFSLEAKMAHDVAAVQEMFSELVQAAWQPARAELDELRQLAEAYGRRSPWPNGMFSFGLNG